VSRDKKAIETVELRSFREAARAFSIFSRARQRKLQRKMLFEVRRQQRIAALLGCKSCDALVNETSDEAANPINGRRNVPSARVNANAHRYVF
jgi:hypothetical protein